MVLFSVPLAVLGLFGARLVAPVFGNLGTILFIVAAVTGFFVAFVSAFGIVDVRAFFATVLPSFRRHTPSKPRA